MTDPRIKRVKKYAQNHIKERIPLKKASEIANLSTSYFSALFKKEVGVSFTEYSRRIRVKKATQLLRKTALSDKEISYELGFRHVSGFCREFKVGTSITPSEYRRKFRLIRIFLSVTGGIVRIGNAIVKIDNAIARFVKKIIRFVNKKRFTKRK